MKKFWKRICSSLFVLAMALLLIPAVNVKAADEPGDIDVYLNDTSHKIGTISKDYLMNKANWEEAQIFSVASKKASGYAIAQGVSLENALKSAGVIEEAMIGELDGATLNFSDSETLFNNSMTYEELTARNAVYVDGSEVGSVTPVLAVYFTDYKEKGYSYDEVKAILEAGDAWKKGVDAEEDTEIPAYSSVAYRNICGMSSASDKQLGCSVTQVKSLFIITEAKDIKLDKIELVFDSKTAQKISVEEITPASANIGNILNQVTWKSSDENIASVSSDGTVTPAAAGTCTITASVSDKVEAKVKVTVNESAVVAAPGRVTISKAVSADYNKAKITWKKVDGADGYIVYRAASKSGTYKPVKTVDKGTTVSFTDSKLTTGKAYYYKVSAYKNTGNDKIEGDPSSIKSVKVIPKTVSGLSVKKASGGKAKISWKKVNGATGYVVYRATNANGKYTKVATVKSLKYTDSKLKSGKKYYYKVRAYRGKGSNKTYSKYSNAKKVTIK